MALFGWVWPKERATQRSALDTAIGDLFDPAAVLRALDQVVPRYLDGVDRHDLIYPACTRTPADAGGDVRSVWEHTRLEAMRYLTMVPGRDAEWLIAPAGNDRGLPASAAARKNRDRFHRGCDRRSGHCDHRRPQLAQPLCVAGGRSSGQVCANAGQLSQDRRSGAEMVGQGGCRGEMF